MAQYSRNFCCAVQVSTLSVNAKARVEIKAKTNVYGNEQLTTDKEQRAKGKGRTTKGKGRRTKDKRLQSQPLSRITCFCLVGGGMRKGLGEQLFCLGQAANPLLDDTPAQVT